MAGVALTEAAARVRLEAMLAWTSDPALSIAEVDELLDMSRVADLYDLPPTNASWSATWALSVGAAEGWRWKAGKAAERFDFNTDVSGFKRDQLQKHCLAMAEVYSRGGYTMNLRSGQSWDPVIGNLNGAV